MCKCKMSIPILNENVIMSFDWYVTIIWFNNTMIKWNYLKFLKMLTELISTNKTIYYWLFYSIS